MYSTLTEKGQITIPATIRQKLGLKKGDIVRFKISRNGIIIKPQDKSLVDTLFGAAADIPNRKKKIETISLAKIRKIVANKLGKKYSITK